MVLARCIKNMEMLHGKRSDSNLGEEGWDHFADTNSDSFYLSGYEAIRLDKSQEDAIKTVISSTISFEEELLVIGEQERLNELEDVCKCLGINYFLLSTEDSNIEDVALKLELMLSAHVGISHVVYETKSIKDFELIEALVLVCQNANVEFIVNVSFSDEDIINNAMLAQVSYLVVPDMISKEKSVIIANRSSLVKTEGVSASFEYDLHSSWQRGLDKRKSGILPMLA